MCFLTLLPQGLCLSLSPLNLTCSTPFLHLHAGRIVRGYCLQLSRAPVCWKCQEASNFQRSDDWSHSSWLGDIALVGRWGRELSDTRACSAVSRLTVASISSV